MQCFYVYDFRLTISDFSDSRSENSFIIQNDTGVKCYMILKTQIKHCCNVKQFVELGQSCVVERAGSAIEVLLEL